MPVIVCCNKKLDIPYNINTTKSEYVKDVVGWAGDVNISISVDDKYCTVIDNYVEYVRGNEIAITSRDRLLLCFQLNTLFIDDEYFKYLVTQVFSAALLSGAYLRFNNWSYMCNMVYSDFNDDLQWSFFIYAHYDFIPKHLLTNISFMKQWNKYNQNVTIKVNNENELYYNNVETLDADKHVNSNTYHTVNGRKVGHRLEIIYFKNGNVMSEINYVDEKINGSWKQWYNNEQNTLATEGDFIDDYEDGVQREWYDDERHALASEARYVNGKRDGITRWWFNNRQHTLSSECNYVNGKLNGVWKQWYNDEQQTTGSLRHILASEVHYINGKRDGHSTEFDTDGNITFDGEYINGIKQ